MNNQWDMHWNTLCLGIVTLAVATVGAAFFGGGVANTDLSSSDLAVQMLQVTKIVFIFGALLVLIRLISAAGKTVFTSSLDLSREGTSKRAMVAYVYVGFEIIVTALIGILVIDLFLQLGAAID